MSDERNGAGDEESNGRAEYAEERNRRTSLKKTAFLETLREKYSVYHACKAADIGRTTVYQWREADPDFAKAWDDAQDDAVDALEQSLFERAMGKDTVAAIFLLKGARPEKYKERVASELTGKNGGPIETSSILPQDEVNARLSAMGMLPTQQPSEKPAH